MQSPTLSPTSWSDPASTLAPEAHHHSPATPGNVSLACTRPPPSPARSHRIWTCPSVPAIPAPGAVWPTTGPKGHPSSWLVHPLSAHHHLPSTSSNIPHCTHTCAPAPSPAALPHWDVPVHPCFPLPGGIFTTNQP